MTSGESESSLPFAARGLVGAEPLPTETGVPSADLFVASDASGARYKLRRCADAAQARAVEAVVERCAGVLPRLLAREGRWLLLEWLEGGRPATPERFWERAGDVARLFAEVHGRAPPQAGDADRWLDRRLERLASVKALDAAAIARVRERYAALRTPDRVRTSLDLHEWRYEGFVEDAGGRWWSVDEEGVGERVRGLGLGGVHRRAPDAGRWRAFLDGYAAVADASWLDADTLRLLSLLHAVAELDARIRAGRRTTTATLAEIDRWSRARSP